MRIGIAFALLAMVIAAPATAALFQVRATGTVGRVGRVSNGVFAGDVSSGVIGSGDDISLSFILDTGATTLGRLYDADPTMNVYAWSPRDVHLTMGGYDYAPGRISDLASYVMLWNGRGLCCGQAADAEMFSIFDDPFGANKTVYPFAMGNGNVTESISLSLFDFTGTARTSDKINAIADPSAFATRRFEYGIVNSDTNLFYHVSSQDMAVSITAVPEPAGWALMTGGLAVLGAAARRRRAPPSPQPA